MSRREFLKKAAVGAVGLGAGGYIVNELSKGKPESRPNGGSEVTAAPSELWKWSREAYDYRDLGGTVRCGLCPNTCSLQPGQRGICRVRVNHGGRLYSLVYGNPCSVHVDPIEKKPLFHFLPASKAFSIATAGCNLRCLNCQNWEISQYPPEETENGELFPDAVVAGALQQGCKSIAYTYNEPTIFYEYMYDTSVIAREEGVRNLWITNGHMNEEPLERFCTVLDAANVDLKGFRDNIYLELNGGSLQPVLKTLKTLHENRIWFEITNLIVPTWTDDLDVIGEMSRWIVKNIGGDYPLHFSRFHPQYKLTKLPPTPLEVLTNARDIASDAGLNYVFVGNAPQLQLEDTICPRCGRTVIGRAGYRITENNLQDGNCRFCGEAIAGVWM
ncbi:MAG: AmmeMemoRadiSam system radical SAM enzyme [Candidatus Altiarchaeales archaeon]|nr:AmmeMemoRadiSam system radical SAM enzyme [Candidatus Altiarchaeales archaeon]MBD3417243.1 AmmeMemoRadiSam system radical SAM enzyme [Candidatus Altiarchaeales archaeon]